MITTLHSIYQHRSALQTSIGAPSLTAELLSSTDLRVPTPATAFMTSLMKVLPAPLSSNRSTFTWMLFLGWQLTCIGFEFRQVCEEMLPNVLATRRHAVV